MVLSSRIFFSAASAAAGEAPLLAGEARCGEARSYVYTCGPLLWFANEATFCRESAGAPRLVCPAVAATPQGTVVDGPLTSFLGGGCAIGRLRPGASGQRPAQQNAHRVRSQLESQPNLKIQAPTVFPGSAAASIRRGSLSFNTQAVDRYLPRLRVPGGEKPVTVTW